MGRSDEPVTGTDDPELYESERWGHFSYAIPATRGRYNLVLHFVEHNSASIQEPTINSHGVSASEPRVFDVFCNGKAIIQRLNVAKEAGEKTPLVRRITGLEPNAQGKLLLEFVPVTHYATVSAIEVIPQ